MNTIVKVKIIQSLKNLKIDEWVMNFASGGYTHGLPSTQRSVRRCTCARGSLLAGRAMPCANFPRKIAEYDSQIEIGTVKQNTQNNLKY